jgi:hypothetical protein
MLCHKDSTGNTAEERKSHNPFKHIGMMGICCLLPIIILAVLPLLNIANPGANTVIASLSSLICPVMMGIMMFSMFRGEKQKACCKEEKKELE